RERKQTQAIAYVELRQHVIAQLCEGVLTVSIYDFGAGFTSLAYLGSLAVRELKLDRGFITPLVADGDGRDLELVRATIDLGHALGLRVVAEGIETAGTLDLLARIGCDLAQGFFISRPVPASDLALHADFRPAVPSVDELKAS